MSESKKMGGFDLDKTVEYWRSGARYDLGVAVALLKVRKYPYALFMGHLAVEKLLNLAKSWSFMSRGDILMTRRASIRSAH